MSLLPHRVPVEAGATSSRSVPSPIQPLYYGLVRRRRRLGVRWVPHLGDRDLDPHLLIWDIHRNIDLTAVPHRRTVLQFTFGDVDPAARRWWIIITGVDVDVCDFDPGHPVDLTIVSRLRTLVLVWRGDVSWTRALRAGDLTLHGSAPARHCPGLSLSPLAGTPRPEPVATVTPDTTVIPSPTRLPVTRRFRRSDQLALQRGDGCTPPRDRDSRGRRR